MRNERAGDRIDAAIDAAGRSLTGAEPSAALRVRVRARVGARSFVASAFRRKWLVPVGAMAALIAVMIVGRALLGPPGGPDRVRPTDVADIRPANEHVSPPGPPDAAGRDKVQPTVSTATLPPMRRLVAVFEPPLEELEPLIPPITIAPLETRLISVDTSSRVMPIEIEPLRIEPLQGE